MIIRDATAADMPAVCEIYSHAIVDSVISFEMTVPSTEEMTQRFERVAKAFPYLVSECDSGEVAGYAYASRFRDREAYDWTCEVTLYVSPRHQRKGHGARLYRTLHALLIRQGFTTAIAGIALPNEASVAVHRHCGYFDAALFPQCGYKLGKSIPVAFMQCNLIPHPESAPSAKPLAPSAIPREEWQRILESETISSKTP